MNILCTQGDITGVIDWGDCCVGDVAADLASFWILFNSDIAEHSLEHDYHASPDQIERGRACAVFFGLVFLDVGISEHPDYEKVGRTIFEHLNLI